MKRTAIHLAAAALSLFLCVLCLPQKAAAYTWIPQDNLDGACTLTIHYHKSAHDIPDVRFSVYRVAEVDSHVTFRTVAPFTRYSPSYENLGRDGWTDLSQSLREKVDGDGITALRSGLTNSRGRLVFEGLDPGLYLVIGEGYEDGDGERWEPTPFMICLPNWVQPAEQGQEGYWTNDVTVEPKPNYIDDEPIMRKVLKVWRDGNRVNQRPSSITVDLLRNGRVYDTVRLSDRNNWRYTWEDLDPNYRWRVEERTQLDNYTTTVTLEGVTFVVTNRWDPPDDPPGTDPDDPSVDPPDDPPNPPQRPLDPETPDNPPDDPPDGPPDIPLEDPDIPLADLPDIPLDDPDIPLDDGVFIDDMDIPLSDLPQTGVLWWPVPFLAVLGMFFIILGWGWNRRSALEEE